FLDVAGRATAAADGLRENADAALAGGRYGTALVDGHGAALAAAAAATTDGELRPQSAHAGAAITAAAADRLGVDAECMVPLRLDGAAAAGADRTAITGRPAATADRHANLGEVRDEVEVPRQSRNGGRGLVRRPRLDAETA